MRDIEYNTIDDDASSTSVTGRDTYLVCKGLAYAITSIARLSGQWQESSDMRDMRKLLRALAGGEAGDIYLACARSHLEMRGLTVIDGQLVVALPGDNVVDLPAR